MTKLDPKSILLRVLSSLPACVSIHARQVVLQTITIILRDKPFMLNQHGIEQIIPATTKHLLASTFHPEVNFPQLCHIARLLLLNYRARLEGRHHLLVQLFQSLLTSILQRDATSTTTTTITDHAKADSAAHIPTPAVRDARSLSRLLELFCRPPPPRHRKPSTSTTTTGTTPSLIDESRRAQAQAGQVIQYVVHTYCAGVLAARVDGAVRGALAPGLWAALEAMAANNEAGVQVLGAAMTHGERAVLRGVVEEWRRSGRWEGL